MLTGVTLWIDQVRHFDNYFSKNYGKIRNEAVSITQHYQYADDLVNDVYLKVKRRIWLSGFTGTNVHGYIWQSILNEWRLICNKDKVRQFVSIENENSEDEHHEYRPEVEKKLQEQNEWNEQQEDYYQSVEFVVNILFNYVETRYDQKAATLFKMYFLVGDTYLELCNITGYSLGYVSKTLKPIKQDVRDNFSKYLKIYVKTRSNKNFVK